jgi:hypothetical protein
MPLALSFEGLLVQAVICSPNFHFLASSYHVYPVHFYTVICSLSRQLKVSFVRKPTVDLIHFSTCMELSIFTVVTNATNSSLSTSPITWHFTSFFAYIPTIFRQDTVTYAPPPPPSNKNFPFPHSVLRFSLYPLWPLSLVMWHALCLSPSLIFPRPAFTIPYHW